MDGPSAIDVKDRAARRELRARAAELRAQMAQERARLRAEIRARRPDDERRRRRRIALFIALLLLLLLLLRCDCTEDPPPVEVAGPATPGAVIGDAAVVPPPPVEPPARAPLARRPKRRLKSKDRPKYRNEAPAHQSWLPSFRLQVAARGPRLSRCFEGADQPGAFKWTASVDTARGVVSDHQFEEVLAGVSLSKTLRVCLVAVLSTPPYRLTTREVQESPSRVSIIIEF